MRRALPVVALLLAAAALVAVVVLRGGEEPYRVRAIFDDAGFVIPGEDVKVAGVRVGVVEDVSVTRDARAALVLRIQEPAFQDFRADAECRVRPQGLIGERFVECEPTQARAPGEAVPPPLRAAADEERLLPVEQTATTVDLDLINNIMREPYRERLSLILNSLGTGLAGRGRDLDAVIRRADPALRELDEVLAILARQNRSLAALAEDADTVLGPLARERRRVGSAVGRIGDVATATAERRADLEAALRRLPRFLAELRPTLAQLGALAAQATPVLADVGAVAPSVNTAVEELGPFSDAATTALVSLGRAGERSIPAVRAAEPLATDLAALGRAVRPVGATLAGLLGSFQRTGGIGSAMDFLFYGVAAINGYDAYGHYLRASLIVNQCSNYATTPVAGCSANFRAPAAGGSAQRAAASTPAPAPAVAAPAPASGGAGALDAEDAALLDYLFGPDE